MPTNKDRGDAVLMTKIWMRDSEGNQLEDLAGIISRIRAEAYNQGRKDATSDAMGYGVSGDERERIRAESAEQARKEAAERAVGFIRDQGMEQMEMCGEYDDNRLRAAILGDSVVKANLITDHIPDVGNKLAIAVKALRWALEYIGDGFLPEEGTPDHDCGYTTAPDKGYCEFCENYWIARDALKEIQG